MGGIDLIKDALNRSHPTLRAESAHVIGSAAQNNPAAQILLLEHGILQILTKAIATTANFPTELFNADENGHLISRTLYAVSAVIRNFPLAQQRFIKVDGMNGLKNIVSDGRMTRKIKGKIFSLVADLLVERVRFFMIYFSRFLFQVIFVVEFLILLNFCF